MTVNVNFRKACKHDAEKAVPLLYSSGISQFEYGFSCGDCTAMAFLKFAFADGRGFFGWRNHTVVTLDNAVVGIGAFYNGHEYWQLSIELIWQVLRFYPFKYIASVLWHIHQLQKLMPKPSADMHYIANFAVRADMRSHNIGTSLLLRQQSVAKQLGRTSCALDVSVDNPRAQALYERLGFKAIKRQKFNGKKACVADTLRMEIPLDSSSLLSL
jgi:ribosomal protein S18 acetylase RimI-like enzyme